MKILLVNIDSKFNIAIRKMYTYFKMHHEVDMVDIGFNGYPSKKYKVIDGTSYDKVYVSNIFDVNKDKYEVINCNNVTIGGIGSNNPSLQLPSEIEFVDPYYFDDEDTSYGFITRGCIRNCSFCKVPKFEGSLKFYNNVESIIKHKKVKFMDNNILAYEKHMEVFQYLIDHNIKCDFNQGLDFRLINDENARLLSKLNYMGVYIFAFDEPKYMPLLEEKLKILKKYVPLKWQLKFYIYQNRSMNIADLIKRVEWCRDHECLPYIMRDIDCWGDVNQDFFTDYASYCNQAGFFKGMDFETFLHIRYKNNERIDKSLETYRKNL